MQFDELIACPNLVPQSHRRSAFQQRSKQVCDMTQGPVSFGSIMISKLADGIERVEDEVLV